MPRQAQDPTHHARYMPQRGESSMEVDIRIAPSLQEKLDSADMFVRHKAEDSVAIIFRETCVRDHGEAPAKYVVFERIDLNRIYPEPLVRMDSHGDPIDE